MHTIKRKKCDFDRRPMTLKFNRVLEVVEIYVDAKFHKANEFMSYRQ